MRRVVLAVAVALIAAPAAAAQEPPPPGLSRAEPISVFGETIGIDEIEHWARIVARAAGGGRARRHFDQAATLLISNRWVEGEARAQGIRVSRREVRREFREQRDQSFSRRRDYRKFLRTSGQTQAELLARVRIDILAGRLRDRAIGDATDPREQQRRLDAFVRDFRTRWRSVTLCTPRFAHLRGYCANGADAG